MDTSAELTLNPAVNAGRNGGPPRSSNVASNIAIVARPALTIVEESFMKLPLLAALGIALGILDPASSGMSVVAAEEDIANLTRRSADANAALIRGDIEGYLALIEHAKDYTLMSPFGGTPTHGFDPSPERRKAIARFFKSGTFRQEVVATYGSADMVVLVTIERIRGEVGGLQEQDWSLRVTQVYRREGAEWQLVHRHADPLANGVSLEQAAALARGNQR